MLVHASFQDALQPFKTLIVCAATAVAEWPAAIFLQGGLPTAAQQPSLPLPPISML